MNEKFFTLSPEKQARITNAALEVFARNDYKHASTDDIAAKAGISKGLLFYYFRNKQSLYLYLYDYALEQVRGQVLRQKLDGVTDFFELMHIGARAKLELLTRCWAWQAPPTASPRWTSWASSRALKPCRSRTASS